MSRASWALPLLFGLSGSMTLHAQILTEEDFLQDALRNHPDVAAAEAGVEAAAGVRRQAGIVDNPEIAWEREDPDIEARQDTVLLTWRLPLDGRRHRMAAADSAIEASSSEVEAVRLRARLEMRALFASWYLAAEREAILEENLERTRRLAERMWARAEDGESSRVEAHRLDLEVEVLRRETAFARADVRAQRAAAATWSRSVTDDVEPVRPVLPLPPISVDIDDRADIAALTHRAEAAESKHQLQKRALAPPVIGVGWTEIGNGVRSTDGPVFGIAWPLPLFDRNQGSRDAASAEVTIARFELEGARRRANQESRAMLASYTELFDAVNRESIGSDDSVLLETMLAVFEAGEAGLTDVLDTLRATVNVRMARVDSFGRALAAERELESALGRPIISGENS